LLTLHLGLGRAGSGVPLQALPGAGLLPGIGASLLGLVKGARVYGTRVLGDAVRLRGPIPHQFLLPLEGSLSS
jgi:hypothetical protein